ncbi:hypothetical protein ACOTVT_05920 [Aliarcobacter butzleri]
MNSDKTLFECNLKRFLEICRKTQFQTTTRGLKLKDINGTFYGFKIKANFGSGNLVKRPSLAFLKDNNTVSKGIYPIIVYIPDKNELITCKGVSFDNKSDRSWSKITKKDIVFENTPYNDEKGKYSYFRNSYNLDNFNGNMIENIIQDIINIIEDY